MLSKRVLVSALALNVAFACAEAQDDSNNSSSGNTGEGGKSSGGQGGVAGKLTSAGTTGVSQGATSTSGGAGTSGSGSGGKSGSGGASGSANGGNASGGRAGSGSGGTNGGSSSAGTSSAGTSAGGTASAGTGPTGLACVEEPVPDPGAGGADAGGAGGAGGAPDLGAAANLFFDDFESGVSKWTTTLGTWALIADGSQAFEQSVQENKLQIGIANGLCAADQVIDAKLKVVAFKGQSSSYVAALFGRALSPTTHYLLALGSDGKLALRKRINSTSTGASAIGSAVTMSITVGQWYDVHFELIGTSLKGCIGAVCVTGTDSSIASGSVGVGTVNTSARFDDVRLTTP